MSTTKNFITSKRYNTITYSLMAVGVIAIILLYITTHGSAASAEVEARNHARFWASLLQNSVYFLLVVNAAMFFMTATTLAWSGWQIAFTRVTEAVSAVVPILGLISGLILLSIVFGDNHTIFHWTDAAHVEHDPILNHKKGFLSKNFFTIATIITIVGWSFLGWKMRQLSRKTDSFDSNTSLETKKKFVWDNTVMAGAYAALFGLTVLSITPWLWLMSIDAHWYSTMYSWYTFASTFVAGISLIAVFVVYLKSKGYLSVVNTEHLHDLGKFMFAFSIFWTYLWFDQFMLIWYANIPEETVYFQSRVSGIYSLVFWGMAIINFVAPILILMSKDSKRNYTIIAFMAILILFGHWLNFFQMVFPAIAPDKVPNILYDMGVGLGFVGLIMLVVGKYLSKYPLISKGHPFAKETVIHHT